MLLVAEIGDRQANPDPSRTDILSLLIAARDEDAAEEAARKHIIAAYAVRLRLDAAE